MKKNNKSILLKNISGIICIIIVFSIIIMLSYLIFDCRSYFNREAEYMAINYTSQNAADISRDSTKSFDEVKYFAGELSKISGMDALDRAGKRWASDYKIDCLQFLNQGAAEYRFGDGVGSSTAPEVQNIISSKKYGSTEIYNDAAMGTKCIAVFSPVEENADIDGVITYFAVSDIMTDLEKLNKFSRFSCIAEKSGTIIESNFADGFKKDKTSNIFTLYTNLCNDKDKVDEFRNGVSALECSAYSFSSEGANYILAFNIINSFGKNYFYISIYNQSDLVINGFSLYNRISAVATAMIILTILLVVSLIFSRAKAQKQINEMDEINPILNCNSFKKYMRETGEILSQNRISNYAVLYFDINKFTYIKEHFSEETSDGVLRYVVTVLKNSITDNETYGYVMDDKFVMLIHFTDKQQLGDRIRIIDALISNFEDTKSKNFTLKISVGVYIVDRSENYGIQEMIDRAIIAQKANKKMIDRPFVIYDSKIRNSYTTEAEIESRMEFALKNHEFRVFFQPKYNIKEDKMDGAEALVRWYDAVKNSYIGPDLFISVFEVNNFIVKLDHYVYDEVCKYMSEAIKRRENVYMISVNVSGVTASQPDFVNYYVKNKMDNKIPNGMIMLEFTESFAYDNYESLSQIIAQLKQNGFKCSIDDFGSGYSSLSILKELKMDEIKMDKLFMKPSKDRFKDDLLLKSVVKLGKDFGMKVTQEGIETKEDLMKLASFGCDVIQGFFYSKPIAMSDFIDFVARDTSLESVTHQKLDEGSIK